MNAWCHLPTIIKRRKVLRTAGLATLFVAFITTLFFTVPSEAATGVNQNLNFQARLLNNSGGVVPDGYYNIQFKIYQDGDGLQSDNTGGSPAGDLKWTETYVNNGGTGGVLVKNGYLSVTLGSKTPFGNAIDWNQDTLWLSMNIAGDETECADFDLCSPDGEMLPMKRLTATPFALNAARLGGFEADDFMQNTDTLQTGSLWLSEAVRSSTALQAPVVDTASAGTLTIGSTNATNITLAKDVTVAAGKSLTLAGGNTASRPASPTEGMLYYDTTTKQLLVYANGKWQSDGKTATKIVAASNSPQAIKDGADYVADGTGDQTEINAALTAAAGGRVYLAEGTYTINDSISVPNNTTLAGAGSGTIITIPNSLNTAINALTNTTTGGNGTGITIQDLRLDGNSTNQVGSDMNGIYFDGVGSGSDGSAVPGGKVSNVQSNNWLGSGMHLDSSSNSTITNNSLQNNGYGIRLDASARSIVSNNTLRGGWQGILVDTNSEAITLSHNAVNGMLTVGIAVSGGSASTSITNNTLADNQLGIAISMTSYITITSNTVSNSEDVGIHTSYSSYTTINSNTIHANEAGGISLSSHNGTVTNNTLHDNGGSAHNNAISLISANNNTITGNSITDSSATTTNYAISVDSNSNTNYLADNSLGSSSINDAGTDTVFGGQVSNAGNYVIQPAGTIELQKSTNVTGSLSASDAVLTPAIDRSTSGTLTIGATNATSITIGRTGANTATTVLGTAVFKPTSGNDSVNAFQIQRANGTALFTADTVNQTIIIGDPSSANKTIISTSTGQIVKYGTARNTKHISLVAEYSGAVLDAGSGSNNSGTMTSSVDLTNRMNYYKWTSSQGTSQSYDVVVQVPLPADFDGWASSNPLSIATFSDDTSKSTLTVEARDSTNTVRCNFVSITPGSNSTWSANNSACTLNTGTYTAGDFVTLRIRMSAQNDSFARLGNINLSYLSKY